MVRHAENWRCVKQPLHEHELAAIKTSVECGRPLGDAARLRRTFSRLNLGRLPRGEGSHTQEKL